jgi:hypothetical protein
VRVSGIDKFDAADDFKAVRDRDDGYDAFYPERDLVSDDARDQDIAMLPRITQQIEVPDMKEVACAGGVADAVHLWPLLTSWTSVSLV